MEGQSKMLRVYLQQIAEENGYGKGRIEIQPISSGGANYTSDIFLATVSAPPKEDLKLFAKVANVGASVREKIDPLNLLYHSEYVFYSKLAVVFNNLYNKNGVPEKNRLYLTKYYGYKSDMLEEILVLENLAAKGFGNFNRMKTFDWDYASEAVTNLARFHALGIAFREENLEEFNKVTENIGADLIADRGFIDAHVQQGIKMGTEFVKYEYGDKLQKYLNKENLSKDLELLMKKNNEGFLIHGDYRPSNLMHRVRNGKVEVIPLDYQTIRLGRLVTDLMYLVWTSSDSQFRKVSYQHLLDHYYTSLTHSLRDLHVDISKVYPRKDFEEDLEELKTVGLLISLTMMNMLTVDPEDAPKFDSVDCMAILPNQLALDRMNDIVGDYVARGII